MKCSFDAEGRFCLDNVDVGGILPATDVEPAYLMAVLNAPVCDFVFRIISKPFQNDYRSANKQFIAPLPVPNASAEARANVAARARRLQQRWTHRRDLLQQADDRLSVLARARHPARWLWPDLPNLPEMTERAPKGLRLATDRRKWAEERLDEMEAARVEALQAALDRGGRRQVRFERGELRLYVSGAVVLDKIYLDEAAGRLGRSVLALAAAERAGAGGGAIRGGPATAARALRRARGRAIHRACGGLGRRGCGNRGRRACVERNALRSLPALAGRTKSCGERAGTPQRGAGGRVN